MGFVVRFTFDVLLPSPFDPLMGFAPMTYLLPQNVDVRFGEHPIILTQHQCAPAAASPAASMYCQATPPPPPQLTTDATFAGRVVSASSSKFDLPDQVNSSTSSCIVFDP